MTASTDTSIRSFWDRQSWYAKDGFCVLVLLILALAYFGPVVFGDQGLHGSDTVNWRSSAEAMIEYREATGEEPLWSPNVFAGMPGYLGSYRIQVPQLDDLVNLFRDVAWPASHLFVLLLGMYVLVFYLTGNRWSGLLSAIGMGFTTFLMVSIAAGHGTKFVALAYAPYMLLAFAYVLRNPGLLGGLFLALTFALNLRANHPQITYDVLFLMLIWFLVELTGHVRRGAWEKMLRPAGYMAAGAVLGLLMVAQPYLSIYEYKDYSTRGGETVASGEGTQTGSSGLQWQYAMQWSQGPGEMVTFLIADAYGGGEQTYWGPKPFTAGPHYLGGLIILLALLALWRIRANPVRAMGIGAAVMSLFAMGRHVPWLNRPMFEYFPYFNAFRTPEIWLAAVALALCVLAGYGLAYAAGDVGDDVPERRTDSLLKAGGGLLALVFVLWLAGDALFAFEGPNERQQLQQQVASQNNVSPDNPQVAQAVEKYLANVKSDRQEAFSEDAFRTVLVLILGIGLLWLYRREHVAFWTAALGVVVIVAVDLWGVDRRYLGPDQFQENSDLEQQIPTYSWDRFIEKQVQQAGGPGHFRTLPLALSPMTYAPASYHYESTGGYHGAKLQIYQDYIDHILFPRDRNQPNENALDLTSTRYIIARQQLPGTEVVFRDQQQGILVLENEDYLPRAFFVGETEVISSPQETWERIRSPEFDPRRTAILSEEIDFEPAPIDSTSSVDVELESFSPREITWEVETDASRLMVVSEVYYPAGWHAYVDGEEVPIHRADYLLRAVPVPEGEHTVRMRFEPASYVWGVRIAGVSTALVYGGILVLLGLRVYRRREEERSAFEEESDEEAV